MGSAVSIIPMLTFDYHALKLTVNQPQRSDTAHKLTRFEPWWLDHEECNTKILKEWRVANLATPHAILESLEGLKRYLYVWSTRTFGVIPKKIKKQCQLILKLESEWGNNIQLKDYWMKLQILMCAENGYWQ